jgi:hypothetical protein
MALMAEHREIVQTILAPVLWISPMMNVKVIG